MPFSVDCLLRLTNRENRISKESKSGMATEEEERAQIACRSGEALYVSDVRLRSWSDSNQFRSPSNLAFIKVVSPVSFQVDG